MEETVTRREHEEFARRIDEENTRQNHRLELLEKNVQEMTRLTTNVERLAVSMENMIKEQTKQGERLEALEQRDGEKWRTIASYVITMLVGAVISYALSQIGM